MPENTDNEEKDLEDTTTEDASPTKEEVIQQLQTTENKKVEDIPFPVPDTKVENIVTQETTNIEFEKYKLKINLLKWVLGTFLISVFTIAINWSFKDRAVGLNEISSYDKYVTELIVKNNNPVKKRMVAQFFANVTPSWWLRCGWSNYYNEVNVEYLAFMSKNDSIQNLLDSLKQRYPDLLNASPAVREQIKTLDNIAKEIDNTIKEPVVLPGNSLSANTPTIFIQYSNEKNKEDVLAIQQNFKNINWNAPGIEYVSGDYKNLIKYFHQEDSTIANGANKLLGGKYMVIPIINSNVQERIPVGQIEIWIQNNK